MPIVTMISVEFQVLQGLEGREKNNKKKTAENAKQRIKYTRTINTHTLPS